MPRKKLETTANTDTEQTEQTETAEQTNQEGEAEQVKEKRRPGRPKGSKNKPKNPPADAPHDTLYPPNSIENLKTLNERIKELEQQREQVLMAQVIQKIWESGLKAQEIAEALNLTLDEE